MYQVKIKCNKLTLRVIKKKLNWDFNTTFYVHSFKCTVECIDKQLM